MIHETHCPHCGGVAMLRKHGELCQSCKRLHSGRPLVALKLAWASQCRAKAAMYAREERRTGFGSQYEQAQYAAIAAGHLADARAMLVRCWP